MSHRSFNEMIPEPQVPWGRVLLVIAFALTAYAVATRISELDAAEAACDKISQRYLATENICIPYETRPAHTLEKRNGKTKAHSSAH